MVSRHKDAASRQDDLWLPQNSLILVGLSTPQKAESGMAATLELVGSEIVSVSVNMRQELFEFHRGRCRAGASGCCCIRFTNQNREWQRELILNMITNAKSDL